MNSIKQFPPKDQPPIATTADTPGAIADSADAEPEYPATAIHFRGCQGIGDLVGIWKVIHPLAFYQCRKCLSSFGMKPEDFTEGVA